jgi:hypothetical protein
MDALRRTLFLPLLPAGTESALRWAEQHSSKAARQTGLVQRTLGLQQPSHPVPLERTIDQADGQPRHTESTTSSSSSSQLCGADCRPFRPSPSDMLLSGYRYHRLCHESGWTNVSGWVEDGAPAWPGAFPELPWRRRMARALEASPGWDTSLSYCQALQQAGMRAGLHAEALRTLLSEDGLGKMLEDEAFMRHAAFRGQRVSVCMSSPAWPLVFARLNLSVIKWLGSLNSTRVTGLHASHSTSSALRSVSASGSSYQRSARSVLLGLASSHPGIRSSLLER